MSIYSLRLVSTAIFFALALCFDSSVTNAASLGAIQNPQPVVSVPAQSPISLSSRVDKFGLLPPHSDEFKAEIPYLSNIFNKKKRLREMEAYWAGRATALSKKIEDCQTLGEKNLVEQCYTQVRLIENRLTEEATRSGQAKVNNYYQRQSIINSSRSRNCSSNGSGGYTCY